MKRLTSENESQLTAEVSAAPDAGVQAKPDPETIAELAYSLWEQRGRPNDCPDQDWFEAEKRLGVVS